MSNISYITAICFSYEPVIPTVSIAALLEIEKL